MKLILVRHGECRGQTDPDFYADPDSPLTPLGEKQAQLTGQRLQRRRITHIVSSPLQRAIATASIISESVAHLPIQVWPELSELNNSVYHGLPPEDILRQFPLAVLPDEVAPADWIYGNLTYDAVFERCQNVYLTLKRRFQSEDCVLMVTHGGFTNYFLHVILNIKASQPAWFEIGNCALNIVRFIADPVKERPNWPLYPPVQVVLLSLNDTSHLRMRNQS
jgi:broad specificity phosphatase PhoE